MFRDSSAINVRHSENLKEYFWIIFIALYGYIRHTLHVKLRVDVVSGESEKH